MAKDICGRSSASSSLSWCKQRERKHPHENKITGILQLLPPNQSELSLPLVSRKGSAVWWAGKMANKHVHPENLTRLARKGAACISKGLTPTPVMPLGLYSTFLFQLCEWEFSLVQVHGPPQLQQQWSSSSSGQDQRELLALPPDLHYHSEVAGKGGRPDLFLFPISMVTCSQTSSEEQSSNCAELKVSFWPVKPSSLELRKDQETHNQKKQVMVTWQESIFFPAPSPNRST